MGIGERPRHDYFTFSIFYTLCINPVHPVKKTLRCCVSALRIKIMRVSYGVLFGDAPNCVNAPFH